jgi:hypothetical protein
MNLEHAVFLQHDLWLSAAVVMVGLKMMMVLQFQLCCLFTGVHVLWESVWCMYSVQ